VSGDSLFVHVEVATWSFPSHPDWGSAVIYEIKLVKREGKFTIASVARVGQS
jgi:hypothetical protein